MYFESIPTLRERLTNPRPILLDGATGTELNRRGVSTELPLWSTRALLDAPQTLLEVHRDYVNAGAEILTANTFRTYRRNLEPAGLGDRAAKLTTQAVEIARDAANGRAWVVGSQPPLEDCYSPELTPDDDALWREHAEMSRNLASAGVDGILVETQHTIREAVAATNAATETGLPLMVSFVCGNDGRLLSGESLSVRQDEFNRFLKMLSYRTKLFVFDFTTGKTHLNLNVGRTLQHSVYLFPTD